MASTVSFGACEAFRPEAVRRVLDGGEELGGVVKQLKGSSFSVCQLLNSNGGTRVPSLVKGDRSGSDFLDLFRDIGRAT